MTLASNTRARGEHHRGNLDQTFQVASIPSKDAFILPAVQELQRFGWDGAAESHSFGVKRKRTSSWLQREISVDYLTEATALILDRVVAAEDLQGVSSVIPRPRQLFTTTVNGTIGKPDDKPLSSTGSNFPREYVGKRVHDLNPGQRAILTFGVAALLATVVSAISEAAGSRRIPLIRARCMDDADQSLLSVSSRCTELALWLACAFSGEWLMPTAPAVERPDMFIAACIAFFIMGFIKVRRLEPSESVPCNRPQTNEWRGFMQVAFLLYHFCNYFKAYIPIRAFVAAYVWQTGWGNTLYFCSGRKNPYTIKRFLSMIWRIDFFVVLLSMVTATSWIYYYVVALHTLHFCMVFCFGLCGGFTSKTLCAVRVSSERGDSSNRDLTLAQRWPVYVKLVIFVAIIAVVWQNDVYGNTINKALDSIFGNDFAKEFAYRTNLDRFSSWSGVVIGYLWPNLLFIFGFGRSNAAVANWRDYSVSRILVCVTSAGLFGYSVYTYVHFLDKPKTRDMIAGYNEWHPFMGVLWIALFLLVRNCCAAFRGRILYAFEFLGKYSLELYLLQFHLLLSKSATRLLVLIEGYPYTNLAILFVFYVFAAMRTHELTLYLRSVFFFHSSHSLSTLPPSASALWRSVQIMLPMAVHRGPKY